MLRAVTFQVIAKTLNINQMTIWNHLQRAGYKTFQYVIVYFNKSREKAEWTIPCWVLL